MLPPQRIPTPGRGRGSKRSSPAWVCCCWVGQRVSGLSLPAGVVFCGVRLTSILRLPRDACSQPDSELFSRLSFPSPPSSTGRMQVDVFLLFFRSPHRPMSAMYLAFPLDIIVATAPRAVSNTSLSRYVVVCVFSLGTTSPMHSKMLCLCFDSHQRVS